MADGRGPWKFRDVETLWAALERYHFYHESLRVRRLGDRVSGNTVSAIDQPVWEDILRANQAIDRAMVRLAGARLRSSRRPARTLNGTS